MMGRIIITAFVFLGIGFCISGWLGLGKLENYKSVINYLTEENKKLSAKVKVLSMTDEELGAVMMAEIESSK